MKNKKKMILVPVVAANFKRFKMSESFVFNKDNKGHITGDYPLFLGEKRGVYDNVNLVHPKIFQLYKELKAIDWQHDELDLTQTKMDLMTVDNKTRDVMLLNLAYQWRADSAIGNSLSTLLQPFITNSEYAHAISRIAENENLHALTYSNISRQCLPNPKELFDLVYKTEEVLNRTSSAMQALDELDKAGCKYKLGLISKEEAREYIFKGVAAVFILERIGFMNSFAATFALGGQDICFGAAKYVQKICQDEMIHFEIARYALRDIMKDSSFSDVVKRCMPDVIKMIEDTTGQEMEWNEFLFQDGRSIVGLNLPKLNQWTLFNVQDVYDTFKHPLPFERLKDPLPWIAVDWVDLNSHQNANMEAPNHNYTLNNVVDDGSVVDAGDDLDFI